MESMVTKNKLPWHDGEWQSSLSCAVRDVRELYSLLGLADQVSPAAEQSDGQFPAMVPRQYLEKIVPGDINDPLLKQVLPIDNEIVQAPGFFHDPLQESDFQPVPGVLHKYESRILLMTGSVCAVHCRYCFRRHYPYQSSGIAGQHRDAIYRYLLERKSVSEIILSGGDPLSNKTAYLEQLLEPLIAIPHIKTLRIHTRFPVFIPERIDQALLKWLSGLGVSVVIVVHVNHPREIDENFRLAMSALSEVGVTLLNQSVVLRGVNDSSDVLTDLSHRLFASSVMPYYLHLLDRVQGAAHFELELNQVEKIYKTLLARLPGYLVPRLVRELPGHLHKTPVNVF